MIKTGQRKKKRASAPDLNKNRNIQMNSKRKKEKNVTIKKTGGAKGNLN